MLLENKNAVIYGAGGSVGGAVAHAFAREGARVFLAGRTLATLERVAKEIAGAGGAAKVTRVDALDEQAVQEHARMVVEQAGSIDVSFNAIGWGDIQGTPLVEMSLADFARSTTNAMASQFLIAKATVPHMARQGSGVIMMITAGPGRVGDPNLVGGFGPACAAMEGLSRQLAAELGPQGIRVVCLRSAGSPADSPDLADVIRDKAERAGVTREELLASWAAGLPLRRFPRLAEVGNVAALVASDYASPITGAVANVTCGGYVD